MAGFNLLRGLRSLGKRPVTVTTADVTGLQAELDALASRPMTIDFVYNATTATTLPAANVARTVISARMPRRIDMTGFTEARVEVFAVYAGSTHQVAIEYSDDDGATWDELDGTSGAIVTIATAAGAGVSTAGAWATLAAGAKADVLVRPVSLSGDSANAVSAYRITLHLR